MPPKSCFPITKKQIVFCHTPWCAMHSVLFHFRPALWLMRIKKLILPHRKHRDVLIQTGKEPDLSPLSSSQQFRISSYSNADMFWHDVGNNLRLLQYGFVIPATEHTGFLCEDRMHCWSCFTVEDGVFSRTQPILCQLFSVSGHKTTFHHNVYYALWSSLKQTNTRHKMSASKTTCGAVTYIIRIGLCEQWLFFHIAGQITPFSWKIPNRFRCWISRLLFLPLPVMWLIQKCPVFRLFFETTFMQTYLSGDQAAPGVWNLNSSVSSVEPIVRYYVWILICLYQYQSQSPKRTTVKPYIPIF